MENIVKHERIGCYGIIIKDNKICLIKKANGGYKGKLDLPGGGIEHTEDPVDTLKRELMEEAGVKVVEYKLFQVTKTNIIWEYKKDHFEDLHHIGILYTVKIESDKLKKEPDGLDSNGASWYDISLLNKKDLSPFAMYAIENIKNNF